MKGTGKMLNQAQREGVYLASGFAHPNLAGKIAKKLGTDLGPVEMRTFPNGEIYSRYEQNVRDKHVFIVQPHVRFDGGSVNDAIMQQCLMADAARSSSAASITAVCPFMAYSRQDRKSRGREPIGTRVLIDQLASAGVRRIVTVDLHSAQAQGIFRGPFDHLTAQPLLRQAIKKEIKKHPTDECLVVAPDAGAGKMAERHRKSLGTGLLYMAKVRDPQDSTKIKRDQKVPEAEGRACMLFDDMIDTAGTLVSAAEALKNSGASAVYVAATHGIFSEPAIARLKDAPIDRIVVSDTFPQDSAKESLGKKLKVVSVATMVASALEEIIVGGSVSRIFDDQNHM